MNRLSIPAPVVEAFEAAGVGMQRAWTAKARPDSLQRVGRALAEKHVVRENALDLEASLHYGRRHNAQPNSCYWNARRALVDDPDLRAASYVEGVAAWSVAIPGAKDVQFLGLEAQGWLEIGGRVIDPTCLLEGPTSPAVCEEARAAAKLHIPVLRFRAAEVADAPLPRLLYSATDSVATFECISDVMFALDAELVALPAPGLGRAARLGVVSVKALRLAVAAFIYHGLRRRTA